MSLAHRVIPVLLARGDQLVKGERFQSWRSVGHVEQAARICGARGVDETILLDIAATPEGRGPDLGRIERITESFFTPLTVGGGVRSVEDVRQLLRAGADKVSICTQAYREPGWIIRDAAEYFGRQAIVFALDVMGGNTVMFHCGQHGYSHVPVYCAQWAADHGAGEILLTSIDREGTMAGYDLDLIREVSEAVGIPVIAHGGCSGPEDMLNAIRVGASACAAGALFQFTDTTPMECSRFLQERGVEARV